MAQASACEHLCASKPSTPLSATARKAKPSLFRWTTSWSSRSKLDELGIDYIEGGWPNSNPKDKEFFQRARDLKLNHARLVAFGSTRFSKNKVEQDPNVRALLEAETPIISIFGKSWDLHVHRALGISEEENLKLISETVKYLKDHGHEVVYDAEHFFDGYNANPDFALRTLEAAKTVGRRCPVSVRHQRRQSDPSRH